MVSTRRTAYPAAAAPTPRQKPVAISSKPKKTGAGVKKPPPTPTAPARRSARLQGRLAAPIVPAGQRNALPRAASPPSSSVPSAASLRSDSDLPHHHLHAARGRSPTPGSLLALNQAPPPASRPLHAAERAEAFTVLQMLGRSRLGWRAVRRLLLVDSADLDGFLGGVLEWDYGVAIELDDVWVGEGVWREERDREVLRVAVETLPARERVLV